MLPGSGDKPPEDFYVSSEEENFSGDALRDNASHFLRDAYTLLRGALGSDRVSSAGKKFKVVLAALIFLICFSSFLKLFPKIHSNGVITQIADTSGFIGGMGLFFVVITIAGIFAYLLLQRMSSGSLENMLSDPELLDFVNGDEEGNNLLRRITAYAAAMILSVFGGFVDTVVGLIWLDDRKSANVIRYKRGGAVRRTFKQILKSWFTTILLIILFALLIVAFMSVVLPALLK
jgi:hypothetical protein